jgi:hypothetical protein
VRIFLLYKMYLVNYIFLNKKPVASLTMDTHRKPIIIGLCGLEGSGKNTSGNILMQKGFKQRSFANTLKHAVSHIFGWEFEMLEGVTEVSRKWREEIDPYWSHELNMPELTPRKILQLVGTNIMRNHLDDNIWMLSLKRQLLKDIEEGNNVIITDCRFPSEAEYIKKLGGIIIKIERQSSLPLWLQDFHILANSIDPKKYVSNSKYCTDCAQIFYEQNGTHPAETSLLAYSNFDYVIENNSSEEALINNINTMLNKLYKNY